MDRRKIAQIQRIASASHDASDNGMYLSVGRVDSPLYSPGRAGTAIWSSRSPPSSPSQMLSPTRGPLDEEELQSRIRAGEEQELDVRATLAEVEAELSICHADTSCCYETLLMGVEDLSAAALEEIFLMQRLVGCFHKTNIINGTRMINICQQLLILEPFNIDYHRLLEGCICGEARRYFLGR